MRGIGRCVPNKKPPCLILWLGEVCTDNTNADAIDEVQRMIEALWLINQMSQKGDHRQICTNECK